jgi:hypothetical protein
VAEGWFARLGLVSATDSDNRSTQNDASQQTRPSWAPFTLAAGTQLATHDEETTNRKRPRPVEVAAPPSRDRVESSFLAACRAGDLDHMKAILGEQTHPVRRVREPASPTTRFAFPLRSGTSKREQSAATELVTNRAHPLLHSTDHYGNTPMHLACREGHAQVVSWLLDHGGGEDVHTHNSRGQTPYRLASYHIQRQINEHLERQEPEVHSGWGGLVQHNHHVLAFEHRRAVRLYGNRTLVAERGKHLHSAEPGFPLLSAEGQESQAPTQKLLDDMSLEEPSAVSPDLPAQGEAVDHASLMKALKSAVNERTDAELMRRSQ